MVFESEFAETNNPQEILKAAKKVTRYFAKKSKAQYKKANEAMNSCRKKKKREHYNFFKLIVFMKKNSIGYIYNRKI